MDTADVVASVLNLAALTIVLLANRIIGRNIKAISDANPTPITPPPPAFFIWAVLYSLLLAVFASQFFDSSVVRDFSGWFVLSCAATTAWLLAYTRSYLKTAAVLLALTTACIAVCYARVQSWSSKMQSATWVRVLASVTFSLYLGWAILATSLNSLQVLRVGENLTVKIAAYLVLYASITAVGFSMGDPCVGVPFAWAALWKGVWTRDLVSACVGVTATLTSGAIALFVWGSTT